MDLKRSFILNVSNWRWEEYNLFLFKVFSQLKNKNPEMCLKAIWTREISERHTDKRSNYLEKKCMLEDRNKY